MTVLAALLLYAAIVTVFLALCTLALMVAGARIAKHEGPPSREVW